MKTFPLILIIFLAKFAYGTLESDQEVERHIIIGKIGEADGGDLTILALGVGKVTLKEPTFTEYLGQKEWTAKHCSITISKPFRGCKVDPKEVVEYMVKGQAQGISIYFSLFPVGEGNLTPNTDEFQNGWFIANTPYEITTETTVNFRNISSVSEEFSAVNPLPPQKAPPQRPRSGAGSERFTAIKAHADLKLSSRTLLSLFKPRGRHPQQAH